jgi:hypothetical protein
MTESFLEWLRKVLHKARVNLTIGDKDVVCEITVPREEEKKKAKPRVVGSSSTKD